jgi:ABC-type dipeptide/oligopeptide/nickel transport system permease subunit
MNLLSDAQLAKILSAINALHTEGWWQWFPVVAVFVSALLAMLVGIGLETYKNSRILTKALNDKLEKEVSSN